MTTATKEEIAELAALTKAAKIGVLTTVDSAGHLVSRPMGMQEIEFDGDLWFFTQHPSPKTDDIAGNPEVNVSFESNKGYVSLAGTATIVRDPAKIDELWTSSIAAWFPEGREDPTLALIKVSAHSAEYWATHDPKVVVLFKVAKAAVTGGTPDVGENKSFEL